MAGNDVMMGLSVGSLVGVVVGGLFGILFLLTCIVSAVKAVRDRREIKARVQAKRAGLASSNGHATAPAGVGNGNGSGSSHASGRGKGRPNILIIHDGEREERVKRGTGLSSAGSSPRLFPSGPSSSSPGERGSRQTETSTLAEVACHRSGGSLDRDSSPGPGEDRHDSEGFHHRHGRCHLPGQVNDLDVAAAVDGKDVDIAGEAVTYRSITSGTQGRGSFSTTTTNGTQDRGSVSSTTTTTTFPVTRGGGGGGGGGGGAQDDEVEVQFSSRYRHAKGAGGGGVVKNHRDWNEQSFEHERHSTTTHDNNSHRAAREDPGTDTSSFAASAHGFTKHTSKSSSHPATRHGAEPATYSYNARRNSYAAAIANPAWVEIPPVRRHSDEPRHHLTSTAPRELFQQHSRPPRYDDVGGQGTVNLAYDGTDERLAAQLRY